MATVYNYIDMTVCLSALYENGQGAILVSDKMRTLEHPLTTKKVRKEDDLFVKMKKLNDNTYIQTAGNMDICTPFLRELETSIRQTDKTQRVLKVAAAIYQKYRQQDVVNKILLNFGYKSLGEYRNDKGLSPALANDINNRISKHYSPFDLIVVGKDGDKYTIYSLSDPGFFTENVYGNAAVGSGAILAMDAMGQHVPNIKKEEVIKLILQAKKDAEKDDGVGPQTVIIELPEV
jgi:hypothetical protein